MSDYPSMSHVQHITFEGNDCVVMSPEEYGAALADLEAKDYELSALRAELTEARRQLKEASEQKPVAWLVKDYADGFIFCRTKKAMERESENGNLVVPLYAKLHHRSVAACRAGSGGKGRRLESRSCRSRDR